PIGYPVGRHYQCRVVLFSCRCTRLLRLRGESVGQVSVWQGGGVVDPGGLGRVILVVEGAATGLGVEVSRQVLAGQDALQVVGQQNSSGAAAAGVVHHDPALKPQVNEVVIVRVRLRRASGNPPHL